MARPGTSEETRITKLQAALKRAISQGLVSETLGLGPFCELIGVKPATLRPWLDDEEVEASGAFIRGGRGAEYTINPIALIWVLVRYFERIRQDKIDDNRRLRKAVAGDKLADLPPEMPMREVSQAMSLNLQLLAAEKEQGQLVDAWQSRAAFQDLALGLRDALLGAPQRLDPENQWEPEFRESFDNALSDTLVFLGEAGREALSGDAAVLDRPDDADTKPRRRRKPR